MTGDRSLPPATEIGDALHGLVRELYPLCRSLTGEGVRETLRRLGRRIPLRVREVPTGTAVFDWTVPREWNIRDAYVKNSRGERVIDFRRSNLHVVGYSVPVSARMSLAELRPHLHSLPDRPDWVPYRTAYYAETWGFCLAHRDLSRLEEDVYEVRIDSSLTEGSLTYGECHLRGGTDDEILVSCHVCHPSLANDNLSGIALATFLARWVAEAPRRYSYRFLFVPGTIGSITWLALNEARVGRIRHGLVLANVGDPGPVTYKRSRRGDAEVDRAASAVLRESGLSHRVVDFTPWGYDERQFCSPGFDLPVGCLSRSVHGQFPEYHTSADDLQFVRPAALAESFGVCVSLLEVLETNATYVNTNPRCEPQLGRRGLYRALGGGSDGRAAELALLWVLNLSDGTRSLLDIATRSGLSFAAVRRAASVLREHGLLAEVTRGAGAPEDGGDGAGRGAPTCGEARVGTRRKDGESWRDVR